MKKIGIIGGLSSESTQLFYKYLIEEYRNMKRDDCYPEVIIYSLTFCEFSNYMKTNRSKAREILEEALHALEKAGAEIVAIAANTPHMFFDELARKSNVKMISIIDALAEELKKNNIKKVGLLGTKATLTEDFYKNRLRELGIDVLIPENNEIEKINEIIMKELTKGIVNSESQKYLIAVAEGLLKKGAEAIALSCTELPLAFSGINKFKVFDTTRILARKVLELSLSQ